MANIRTFKNLQDEVLQWLDEAGDADVTYTLVKQSIRAAHEKRLTEERWQFMLTPPRTFSTVGGRQSYSLDPEFLRAFYFKNLATNELMVEHDEHNAPIDGNTVSDVTSAGKYALWGTSEVALQPAVAAVIAMSSSSLGDNGVNSVFVAGNTATGYQSETILSGASGAIVFSEITKFAKSDNWAGTMTATAGATTLLSLRAAETGRVHQLLYLFNPPSGAESIEYRFYRQPSPLVADNDRPDFPAPFETLLVWDALLDLATYNEYSPAMVSYWMQKRDALLLNMQQVTNVAQSINRRASYTEYIPR